MTLCAGPGVFLVSGPDFRNKNYHVYKSKSLNDNQNNNTGWPVPVLPELAAEAAEQSAAESTKEFLHSLSSSSISFSLQFILRHQCHEVYMCFLRTRLFLVHLNNVRFTFEQHCNATYRRGGVTASARKKFNKSPHALKKILRN